MRVVICIESESFSSSEGFDMELFKDTSKFPSIESGGILLSLYIRKDRMIRDEIISLLFPVLYNAKYHPLNTILSFVLYLFLAREKILYYRVIVIGIADKEDN